MSYILWGSQKGLGGLRKRSHEVYSTLWMSFSQNLSSRETFIPAFSNRWVLQGPYQLPTLSWGFLIIKYSIMGPKQYKARMVVLQSKVPFQVPKIVQHPSQMDPERDPKLENCPNYYRYWGFGVQGLKGLGFRIQGFPGYRKRNPGGEHCSEKKSC